MRTHNTYSQKAGSSEPSRTKRREDIGQRLDSNRPRQQRRDWIQGAGLEEASGEAGRRGSKFRGGFEEAGFEGTEFGEAGFEGTGSEEAEFGEAGFEGAGRSGSKARGTGFEEAGAGAGSSGRKARAGRVNLRNFLCLLEAVRSWS